MTKKRPASHGSTLEVDVDGEESMSWDGTADADNSFEFLRDDDECYMACDDKLPKFDNLEISNAFEKGVKRKHRKKYHFRHKHKGHTFAGSNAVDFLIEEGYASDRNHALNMGRQLAYDFGLFRHTTNDFDLEDKKNLFYVFTPPNQRVMGPAEYLPYSLNKIADAFEEGVVVGPNVYNSRKFKASFVGSNAVTFLVSSQMAKTRQDAVRIGQLLIKRFGMFEHVARQHKFKDKHKLYRFVPKKQRIQYCNNNHQDSIPIEETAQLFRERIFRFKRR